MSGITKSSAISIAELVGSSKYTAIADDSLKDEDNAAWVLYLPPKPRQEYIELISWVRQIDRMAESEWTEGWGSRFQIFRIGWRTLILTHLVLPDDYHAELLLRMRRRWFSRRSGGAGFANATGSAHQAELAVIHAWDEYVDANAEYHRSDMVFDTIADYQWMLEHLGGAMFQVFSFLTDAQRRAVRAFGVVDLFFNHLRDMPEDTAQGLCYFPADVLDRFGVDRMEIIDGSCFRNAGYMHMMRFWLDDFLPHLYRLAAEFLNDTNLHFTWQILRHWFLRRHARLQRALRACAMDFRAATQMYYADVKPNLNRWIEESFYIAGCQSMLNAEEDDTLAPQSGASKSDLPFERRSEPPRLPVHGLPADLDSDMSADSLDQLVPANSGPDPGDSGTGWLVVGRRRLLRYPR